MPDNISPLLASHLLRYLEDARLAMDRDNDAYATEVCTAVLERDPGCLPARKLLRASQLRRLRRRHRPVTWLRGVCALLLFWPQARTCLRANPRAALSLAEKILGQNPRLLPAHRLLARAAAGCGLHETSAFAWQCACEARPDGRELQIELARAWLEAGRIEEALQVTDAILAGHPCDSRAREIMKMASLAQFRGGGEPAEEPSPSLFKQDV